MKTDIFRRSIALALAVVLAFPSAIAYGADEKLKSTKRITPGLTYNNTISADNNTRQESFILEYTAGHATQVIAMQSSGKIYGLEPIEKAIELAKAQGYNVVAAVNTDYFSSRGIPTGIVIENGIYKSCTGEFPAIAFIDGKAELIENAGVSISLQNQTSGAVMKPHYFNKSRTATGGVYLLNSDFSSISTHTGESGWFVRMAVTEGAMKAAGSMQLTVTELVQGSEAIAMGENEFILTANDGTGYGEVFESFNQGDIITLTTNCEDPRLAEAQWATGTGDLMIKNGMITDSALWQHSKEGAAPRTALGMTADGRMITYVVDGRQSGYSIGLTQVELANEMLARGCVWAVNLDGGGSSAVSVHIPGEKEELVVNKPSDGKSRACATFMLFVTPEGETAYSRLVSIDDGITVFSGGSVDLNGMGAVRAVDEHLKKLYSGGDLSGRVSFSSNGSLGSLNGSAYTAGPFAGTDTVNISSAAVGQLPALSGSLQIHVVNALSAMAVTDSGGKEVKSLTLKKDEQIQLMATGHYWGRLAMRNSSQVKWSVNDPLCGSIDENGLFIAGNRSGNITAEAGGVTVTIPVYPFGIFDDVPQSHWAYNAAAYCYEHGIVAGVAERTFGIGSNIKRCDFVLMLHRIAGAPAVSFADNFSDVKQDDYFAGAVSWAAVNGITAGNGDGSFGAKNSITREQAFAMLGRALPLLNMNIPAADLSVLDKFTDKNTISEYAISYSAALVGAGLVSGNGASINPKGVMSREEMVVLLHKALTASYKPSVAPEAVFLSHVELTLEPGGRAQLSAILLPEGSGGNIVWSSDNTAIATVTQSGLVENRFVSPVAMTSDTLITATVNGLSASCIVTCHSVENLAQPEPDPAPQPSPTPPASQAPQPAPAENAPIAIGVVKDTLNGLNLREKPDTGSAIITKIANGEQLNVLSVSGGWCYVTAGGALKGYVSAEYVSLNYLGTVNSDTGLNLRAEPNTSAAIITRLPHNSQVVILAASNGWYEVSAKANGESLRGYVSAEYIINAR